MPRVLIVGCGCRGQELTRALVEAGHVVRGTTRRPDRLPAIADAGAEPYLGDPDRIGSLMDSLAGVTVAVWLLGTVDSPDLHDGRLRMFCEKAVDTPVRGLLYESSTQHVRGRGVVEIASSTWQIPLAVVPPGASLDELLVAVTALIAGEYTPTANP